jgi:8-oxo-dGTP pyrophosphatase MutT (NUDIX family)
MGDYIKEIRKKVGHDPVLSVGLGSIVVNPKGEILLEKRSDTGEYCLPGGAIELGEDVLTGLRRELFEETGLKPKAEPELLLIRSGEKQKYRYPNGDLTYYVDLCFLIKITDEEAKSLSVNDDESSSIAFYAPGALPPEERMMRGTMPAIRKYLSGDKSLLID